MADELIALQLYKEGAMEALAENERCIANLKLRVEELEYHLKKVRDAAYQICFATAGVVPNEYAQESTRKPAKKTRKA